MHEREGMQLGFTTDPVVVATAKVRIFKQITTSDKYVSKHSELLLLPQRYEFSSKSQPINLEIAGNRVVVATAKVRIFKQITTHIRGG